jgi:hypothetical protein
MKIGEVPIRFYKDKEGRLSHHKRSGWLSPWYAGWINLKAMLLHAPDYFFLKPGLVLFALGLILSLLGGTQSELGPVAFRLHWMLFGVCLTLIGYNAMQIGVLGKIWHGYERDFEVRMRRFFSFDKGMCVAAASGILGIFLLVPALVSYIGGRLRLQDIHYSSIWGILLLMWGFQTLGFTILFELVLSSNRPKFGDDRK